MTEQISPSEVVDVDDEEPIEEPIDSSGGGSSIRDMLLSTDAPRETNVQMLQSEYGLSHGKALIVFGVIKASGAAGMPAIGDILVGAFIEIQDLNLRRDDSGTSSADDEHMPDIAQT